MEYQLNRLNIIFFLLSDNFPSLKCLVHTVSKLCICVGSDVNQLQCKILCTNSKKQKKQKFNVYYFFVDSSLFED